MEIGYLWLALSLFLFLMTTGAKIVIAAVAFPLVARTNSEHFDEVFSRFRKRRMFSYGPLAMLSLVFCGLLSFFPPYSFPGHLIVWLTTVFGVIGLTEMGSWSVARKLKRRGCDLGLLRWLRLLLWVNALAWFAGSCVLVWVFLEVVGLI